MNRPPKVSKEERIRIIRICGELEEIQNNLETAELLVTAQKLAVNKLMSELLLKGGVDE